MDWAGVERPLVQTAPSGDPWQSCCRLCGSRVGSGNSCGPRHPGLRPQSQQVHSMAPRGAPWVGGLLWGLPTTGQLIPSVQLRKSEPKGSSGGPGGSAASTPAQSLEEDGKSTDSQLFCSHPRGK